MSADMGWTVVRTRPDRMGRRRIEYLAGIDMLGGALWARSPRPGVLVGSMADAAEWRSAAAWSDEGGRISLCRIA